MKGESTLIITTIAIIFFCSNIAGGFALVNTLQQQVLAHVLLPVYSWIVLVALASVWFIAQLVPTLGPWAWHIAGIALLSGVYGVHQVILLSAEKYRAHNLLQAIPVVLNFLFTGIGFYYFHQKNIATFLYALYGSMAISLMVSAFYVWPFHALRQLRFSLAGFRQLLANGIRFQLVELLQLLHLRLYFFILSAQDEHGLYRLGIYSVGISILETVWIGARGVATINFSATVKAPSVPQTLQYLRLTLLGAGVGLVLIFLIPVEVYAWVFGEGFTYVKYSVKYLFPGMGLYVVVLVLGSYFLGTRQYLPLVITHLAGIVVSYGLCMVLIPKYEMSGAGLAATISFAVAAALCLFFFVRGTAGEKVES